MHPPKWSIPLVPRTFSSHAANRPTLIVCTCASCISRIPLMLRALVLVPLLAVGPRPGARLARSASRARRAASTRPAAAASGSPARCCSLGYVLAVAGLVGRLARGRSSLWIVAVAGLWAACGGQALLASALGGTALLGGGWLPLWPSRPRRAHCSRSHCAAPASSSASAPRGRHPPRVPAPQRGRDTHPPRLRPTRLTRGRAPPLLT